MRRSRRVLASALLGLLVGLLTTILLVVPAGAAVVSGGKAPSDQPTYSYDSPSAGTTPTANLEGRSELTADPRKLIERARSGDPVGSVPRGQPGFKKRVDFGETIGTYLDPKTGIGVPSSRGIIVYGKRGAHIYPVRP